MGATLERH
ncbi:Protein of unknown function [Propionibacterium freudenreichii]|nr:Protein of unknown function [Propionibacterium freudenreichii subsp. freudenreichii]CEG87003.1 Protein of unknown function [Propionibacterium freudenreichii]CEG88860.1 Protein of unknown function [Propionibacterium freudenreichii]CEG99273.1 Protein of unknown function [Propionibacterium freudenreichii]CEH01567.1 Protein of unknown function [Propionibacterium freudenreichii]